MASDLLRPSAARWPGALATWLATGFGSGYAPLAPGTAGSAVGLLLFLPLQRLSGAWQLGLTALAFAIGVAASTHVARSLSRKDPGIVVVDEIVGMWASLLFLPFTPAVAVLGFLLFRLLDVRKPYPARQLEALPGGLGIMADDLMAGIYANLCLRVIALVVPLA
jgi:phosphatidylglycerophosphatase A